MKAHRFPTFDCLEDATNTWVNQIIAPSDERLLPFVLAQGPIVFGMMIVSPTVRRSSIPRGYIELVAFGVDAPVQNKKYGRAMLLAFITFVLSGDFGENVVGVVCRSFTEACTKTLLAAGFAPMRGNLYGLKLR
jgi:hypothetical protein